MSLKITLDPTLSEIPFYKAKTKSYSDLIGQYEDDITGDIAPDTREVMMHSLTGDITHNNYLEYLAVAYDNHWGIVVSPDILWNMVLCEITTAIRANAEDYRYLFSTSDDKQTISVETDNAVHFPIGKLVVELQKRMPSDIKQFLPTFSTTTPQSTLAQQVTFADAVSPYYNYSMYMCGLRSVTVQGDKLDWEKLRDALMTLSVTLENHLAVASYLTDVAIIATTISTTFDSTAQRTEIERLGLEELQREWWTSMFSLKNCGSGHQVEVDGWIRRLFMTETAPRYIGNYSRHISVMDYKNTTNDTDFRVYSGLFHSVLKDGILLPDFSYVLCKVHNKDGNG
jgi:hypothetical protein